MRLPLSRREVLLGAAGSLAVYGRPSAAFATPFLESAAFPLGVASGEVTSDSAVLWTRYLGSSPLEAGVFAASGEGDALWYGEPEVSDGGFVHLPLRGLSPGARYAYVFRERGGEAQVGAFRAADAPGTKRPLVFTASACSRNGRSFRTLDVAARDVDADLHLLLGDTTYADGSFTREEFRDKWSENLGRGEYRALRAARSIIATWDDHEISNDWAGLNLGEARVSEGKAAFFEHTPLLDSGEQKLWRSLRWGDTAEFFVLDVRSERTPERRLDPSAEYISSRQLEWLKAALLASSARFRIIVSSVPIGEFPGPYLPFTRDRWVGYPAQRRALLEFLEDAKLPGVFFLGGDFHQACLGKVSARGPGSALWEVLVGAVAVRNRNPLTHFCRGAQYLFSSPQEHTARLRLDPETGEVRVRWSAAGGRILAERRFRV